MIGLGIHTTDRIRFTGPVLNEVCPTPYFDNIRSILGDICQDFLYPFHYT